MMICKRTMVNKYPRYYFGKARSKRVSLYIPLSEVPTIIILYVTMRYIFFSYAGGLCYAELGTMLPRSGGEYVFLYTAFGSAPAFLYSWVSNLMVKPAGTAIGYLSFAHYVLAPFFYGSSAGCDPPDTAIKLIAISCMCKYTLQSFISRV